MLMIGATHLGCLNPGCKMGQWPTQYQFSAEFQPSTTSRYGDSPLLTIGIGEVPKQDEGVCFSRQIMPFALKSVDTVNIYKYPMNHSIWSTQICLLDEMFINNMGRVYPLDPSGDFKSRYLQKIGAAHLRSPGIQFCWQSLDFRVLDFEGHLKVKKLNHQTKCESSYITAQLFQTSTFV